LSIGSSATAVYQLYQNYKEQVARQYDRYRNSDGIIFIPLVLLALYEIVGHYFWLLSTKGLPQSADSKWYMEYARCIRINLTDGLDINDVLYFGYNFLLSVLLDICREPATVVLVQAVTASLSVILVYKIAKLLFNKTTAVIASIFYCKTYDITLWSMYVLSDSFFVSLLLLCVYLLLMSFESDKKIYKIFFAVTSLYMLVFRPTGILTMASILIYILIRLPRNTILGFVSKYRALVGGLAAAVFAVLIYLFLDNQLDLFIQSMQFNAKKVLYNVYAKGWIYDLPSPHDYFFRPDYRINVCNSLVLSFIINNWDHVFIIYAKRAAAFLGRWVWAINFQSVSGFLKFADQVLLVTLFLTGTIAAIYNKVFRKATIVWLIILAVFLFCIVIFIDWMYRYRLPAVPFIAIVTAYGAERTLHYLFTCVKKPMGMLFAWIKEKS